MKKVIFTMVLLITILFITTVVSADDEEYDTQAFSLYSILTFNGKLDVESPDKAVFTNPNPTNGSTDLSVSTSTWNVTIKNPFGGLFNWTIQTSPNVGSSSTNYDTNGSKSASISGLSYSTTYTVYINATTGINVSDTLNISVCTFSVEDNPFELYTTLGFGGIVNISGGDVPNVSVNYSEYVEETNATLHGFLFTNQSLPTYCYFEWHNQTADYTYPDGNESVGITDVGTTFSLNASNLSNGTFYYFRTRANNTNGWNSSWNSSYFLTKPQTPTSMTISEVGNTFNISWNHGDGYNKSALFQNHTGYPTDRTSEGTELVYLGENNYYENSSMVIGQTYYYRVWEYAEWVPLGLGKYSDGNCSSYASFQGTNPSQKNPNPSDGETDVLISTKQWNITVKSPHGEGFNWSIESSIGSNLTVNDANNGSKWMEIAGNLSFGTTYTVWVNASVYNTDNWTNDSYTFTVESDTAPIMMNENPTNGSTQVSAETTVWNITIHDLEGHSFNWSIEPSTGSGDSNSSTYSSNRSYNCSLTGLAYDTTYTVWVNVTDTYSNISNNTFYYFTTRSQNFTAYDTLTFSGLTTVQGNNPVLSSPQPTNGSSGIELYPWLNITIADPQVQTMNVTWSTNASGEWVILGYNSSCASGSTQRWRATFANTSTTTYYWNVSVNDTDGYWSNATYYFTTDSYSWSNWSTWWQFNYTCCSPTDFEGSTWNNTVINLTWMNCSNGADRNVVIVNDTYWNTYPNIPSNGTEIYNGTLGVYNHSGLCFGTTYYYTIWGYNITEGNYSLMNYTCFNTTSSPPTICLIYPANGSTNAYRVPMCRIWANDSNGDTLTVNFFNSSDGAIFNESQTNLSVTANSTVYWRYTLANQYSTKYWWQVFVDDGTAEGNVSAVYNFTTAANIVPNLTGEIPENESTDQSTTPMMNITISDDNGDYLNATWWSNSSGAWVQFAHNDTIDMSGGDTIIYQENSNFSALNTTYWWSVNLSDGNSNKNETYNFTTMSMTMETPFPTNMSYEVAVAPTNISISIVGTNVDVYIYFMNMSPETNTTSLLKSFSGENTGRIVVDDLASSNATTEFIFGHTPYVWYVNMTDGTTWINNTYYYQTINQTVGKDARMDVNGNGLINVQDVSYVLSYYSPPYDDTIYDVNWNGLINVQDVSFVLANYT